MTALRIRGVNNRAVCLVAKAIPRARPAPRPKPVLAISKDSNNHMTSMGSVKRVGLNEMAKGDSAKRARDQCAVRVP